MSSKRKSRSPAATRTQISVAASDSEVSSASDDDMSPSAPLPASLDEKEETVDEKRARLARSYLDMVDNERSSKKKRRDRAPVDDILTNPEDAVQYSDSSEGSEDESDSDDSGGVSALLQRKRLNALNTSYLHITPVLYNPLKISLHRTGKGGVRGAGPCGTPTSTAINSAGTVAYTGCKNGQLTVWDVPNRVAIVKIQTGHSITALAAHPSMQHIAVAATDGNCYVYDLKQTLTALPASGGKTVSDLTPIHTLAGHKSSLTAVTYTPNSLATAALDRCVRTYSPQSNYAYTETLYGHQDNVTSMCASLSGDNLVTCGRDRTVRAWNITANSHGIYRPGAVGGSGDAVACVDKKVIVEGGDDGAIRLWEMGRKKPTAVEKNAHDGNWIVSVGTARAREGDCVLTGSWDGKIKVWRAGGRESKTPGLELVSEIPVTGYVNSISVCSSGRMAVVAVGREHRLGRWDVVKGGAKLDRVGFVELYPKGAAGVTEFDDNMNEVGEDESESESESDEDSDAS